MKPETSATGYPSKSLQAAKMLILPRKSMIFALVFRDLWTRCFTKCNRLLRTSKKRYATMPAETGFGGNGVIWLPDLMLRALQRRGFHTDSATRTASGT
jgi:hypothetical protein